MSASIEAKWAHTVDALRAANERIAEHEAEIARLKTAVTEWGDAAHRQAAEVARLTEENALLGRKLVIMQGEQDKLAAEITRLTAALEEAATALRSPTDGWREGAEAMREACIKIADGQDRPPMGDWSVTADIISLAIRALPIPAPPAEEKTP